MLKVPQSQLIARSGSTGTRIPSDKTVFTSTLDLFDANSPRYHGTHWGLRFEFNGASQLTHRCLLILDTRVQRLTPPRRLQERLGEVVIRRRSAEAKGNLHEKLIVAYAPLENADPDLLSLFWVTRLEWNLALPRRSNTIIMTDANGRTGLDYAQAASHDKTSDWNVVVDSFSETTNTNGLW